MSDFIQKPEERLLALLQKISQLPITRNPDITTLSLPQTAMLTWVAHSPGVGVQDIAKGLGVTPPTVSVAARKLAQDGWLERRKDPEDRRTRPLYLTAKGEEAITQLDQHRAKMLESFLSGLAPDEQEQLINLLSRAIQAMEAKLEQRNLDTRPNKETA